MQRIRWITCAFLVLAVTLAAAPLPYCVCAACAADESAAPAKEGAGGCGRCGSPGYAEPRVPAAKKKRAEEPGSRPGAREAGMPALSAGTCACGHQPVAAAPAISEKPRAGVEKTLDAIAAPDGLAATAVIDALPRPVLPSTPESRHRFIALCALRL